MDGFRQFHGGKPKKNGDIDEERLAELGIEGFDNDGN